jgi:hypothetical protein
MNENFELLNYIYQNAGMGKETITKLIDMSKDEEYKKMLTSQLQEYEMICNKAEEKIKELNKEAKDNNIFSKVTTYLIINFNTLINKTPSHLSELLIHGSAVGIVDIIRSIKKYPNADKEIIKLANELLKLEENNVEECKRYV